MGLLVLMVVFVCGVSVGDGGVFGGDAVGDCVGDSVGDVGGSGCVVVVGGGGGVGGGWVDGFCSGSYHQINL